MLFFFSSFLSVVCLESSQPYLTWHIIAFVYWRFSVTSNTQRITTTSKPLAAGGVSWGFSQNPYVSMPAALGLLCCETLGEVGPNTWNLCQHPFASLDGRVCWCPVSDPCHRCIQTTMFRCQVHCRGVYCSKCTHTLGPSQCCSDLWHYTTSWPPCTSSAP